MRVWHCGRRSKSQSRLGFSEVLVRFRQVYAHAALPGCASCQCCHVEALLRTRRLDRPRASRAVVATKSSSGISSTA